MRKILNIGEIPNDGKGDKLRHAFDLSQQNFVEIYKFFGDGQNITSLSVRQKLDTPTNAEVDTKIVNATTLSRTHMGNVSNPHNVTKEQVGLNNVDNTSDANKPISIATQQALNLKVSVADLDMLLYCPIAYPKTNIPEGYLVMMGQVIAQATYPKLYALYGAKLPDMRAYTIRGLDSGRGIDVGRVILSEQGDAIRNITGTFQNDDYWNTPNSIGTGAIAKAQLGWSHFHQLDRRRGDGGFSFDASRVVPIASENRIKSIAFLYIVKAG